MQKIIGVTELQRRFRSVFNEVTQRHIPYILTRGSRPEAVLISYEDFMRFQELQEKAVLARFDRLLTRMVENNAIYSEEEVAVDVETARLMERFVPSSYSGASAPDQASKGRPCRSSSLKKAK